MYGTYDIPCKLAWDALTIEITSLSDKLFHYRREGAGQSIEKELISGNCKLKISPVEPLSTPKFITPYLLIEFSTPVLIAPRMGQELFLTCPLDLGIHLSTGANFQLIDIFTLTSSKYTLYGDPSNGILCKYWKSNVFNASPDVQIYQEAVLNLRISNEDTEWMEVRQVVLNAYGMKIFYKDDHVQLNAVMEIGAGGIAETDFENDLPNEGLKKSVEIFYKKKLSLASKNFIMEQGL
ncbi:MAG: DUF432 domain-containing protein [SAR324 cluster bacterium]|nr:DUF432 domain-containing protein [SAR324 cluster bacterium]